MKIDLLSIKKKYYRGEIYEYNKLSNIVKTSY